MDLLTYTIDRIGLKGQVVCRARGYAPWGLHFPSDFHLPFYLVEAGGGWLLLDQEAPVRLNQGDLVFLPHGQAHRLVDDFSSESTSIIEWEACEYQGLCPLRKREGRGMEAQILYGVYRLEPQIFAEMILDDLPSYIRDNNSGSLYGISIIRL